jgi:hypothetical protein
VTVVDDLLDVLSNPNEKIFSADSFGSIQNFDWSKVAIFYIAIVSTVCYLSIAIWGYFKDKSDSLKVIPIVSKNIASNDNKNIDKEEEK